MCTTCGCSNGNVTIDGHKEGHNHAHHHHDHNHDHHHDHAHSHDHHEHSHHEHKDVLDYGAGPARAHAPGLSQTRMVQIEQDILAKNDSYARENRKRLEQEGVFALNILSGPGAGKTTLLVETLRQIGQSFSVFVIEGDQQTSRDAERIREVGAPAVQINTGKGCHLDAHMVGHAIDRLPLSVGGVLFIENVGNLVCPAAFDLGEKRRVTLLSITEGEDKPLKYPDIFQGADLVLLTKSDLYPHLQVNKQVLKENINRIVPKSHVIDVSSYSGEGMSDWLEWLRAERKAFLESLASQAQLRADMLRKAS